MITITPMYGVVFLGALAWGIGVYVIAFGMALLKKMAGNHKIRKGQRKWRSNARHVR